MTEPEVEQNTFQSEPLETPGDIDCPVCERVLPSPAPDLCPFCSAPLPELLALMKTVELSLTESLRDIKTGDIQSAEKRLKFVRATSQKHRLKVEIIQALRDRLAGDRVKAMERLNGVEERIEELDHNVIVMLGDVKTLVHRDQLALAGCCEHYNFALFNAKRGHYEEARASLTRALGLAPHHPHSHALMGKVMVALGENDRATYHFRRALAVDPSNVPASKMLAEMSRLRVPDLVKRIADLMRANPVWTGSVFVVVILAVIAIAALMSGS